MRRHVSSISFLLLLAHSFHPVSAAGIPVSVNCADLSANPTKYEEYYCMVANGPPVNGLLQDPGCDPRYTRTTAASKKGLVVVFHGYTACPDSFDPEAAVWVNDGYDVMQLLTVGHGRYESWIEI